MLSFLVRAGIALLLCVSVVHSTVVGLDLGSSFIKVGVGRHGRGVQMALNDASKRKTPSALAFHPEGPRRVWGDDALNLMSRYPRLAVPFPQAFIGLSFQSSAEIGAPHPGYALDKHPRRASVLHGDKISDDSASVLSTEVAVAMLLKHSVEDIALEKNERAADGVVVTVPGWWRQQERAAMTQAAKIAGLPVLALMNDHAAVALRYAMDQTFTTNSTQYVLFYDMGGWGTKVSLVSFHTVTTKDARRKEVTQVEVKAVAHDKQLGGRAFDTALAKVIIEEAVKKVGDADQLSARTKTRLHKEAEKARKVLSANKEYVLSVDSITDTIDFKMGLTRKGFEESAKALFDRVLEPVREVLKQAEEIHGFSVDELHSVELVGGAYRMPLVQSTLGNFFKPLGIKVQASLNGDEAAALGATYYAAALQGYNVRAFNLNDVLGSSLEMATDGAEPFEIFGRSSVVPSTRMIQLPKDSGEEVRITDPITGHSWTGSFDLGLASTVPEDSSASLLIGLDRSGMLTLQGGHRFVKHEKEKGPSSWSRHNLNASVLTPESDFGMDSAEMSEAIKALQLWQEHDDNYRARSEARNQLESYLFAARDSVETEDIVKVSTEIERTNLTAAIEQADEWLLSEEASSASAAQYNAKMLDVKAKLQLLELRSAELISRPKAFREAKVAVTKVNGVLSKLKELPVSNDTAVANATAADLTKLHGELEKYDGFIKQKEELQSNLGLDKDPAVLSAELDQRTMQLQILAANIATRANLTKHMSTPSKK